MLADVYTLYKSDVYRITDFKCHCDICSVSNTEYNTSFCMSFIRKGFFEYRTFRRKDEMYTGRILLSKPGCEHTTRHINDQPDITTVFEFRKDFFPVIQSAYGKQAGWFLLNNDIHALLLQCSNAAEYRHHQVMQLIQNRSANSLHIDELVMDLLEQVLNMTGNSEQPPVIGTALKRNHLGTVETAKAYILQHFREPLSLQQLAQHCCISPFHFSRIFKAVQRVSPHQFLTGIRLQHARHLLQATTLPVTDIAFECGFNNPEHFTTTYRQQFSVSPGNWRKESGVKSRVSGVQSREY